MPFPWRIVFVPKTHAVRARAPGTRCFAPETTAIPLWGIMRNQRKFGRENPPLTRECQITAFHIGQFDILPFANIASVLTETVAQCSLAFRHLRGRLPDINERALQI